MRPEFESITDDTHTHLLYIRRICLSTVDFPDSPAPSKSILISFLRLAPSLFSCSSISALPSLIRQLPLMLCDDPQLTRFGGNILGRLSAAHGERDGMKEEEVRWTMGKRMVMKTKRGVCDGRLEKNQQGIYVKTQCVAPCGTDTQPLKDTVKGPIKPRAGSPSLPKVKHSVLTGHWLLIRCSTLWGKALEIKGIDCSLLLYSKLGKV